MRNPERVPIILTKLNQAWSTYPDMRFCQLIEAILSMRTNKATDSFYLEDEKFEVALDEFVKGIPAKTQTVISLDAYYTLIWENHKAIGRQLRHAKP